MARHSPVPTHGVEEGLPRNTTKAKKMPNQETVNVPLEKIPEPDYGVLNLYSIRDKRQPRSFPPFDSINDGVAMRHFANMMISPPNAPPSTFLTNASDYEMWHVGVFNQAKGLVTVVDPPEYVCSAADLVDSVLEKTQ